MWEEEQEEKEANQEGKSISTRIANDLKSEIDPEGEIHSSTSDGKRGLGENGPSLAIICVHQGKRRQQASFAVGNHRAIGPGLAINTVDI